ncbi:hypothetical protein DFH08DRAFT_960121 [Mycena albidolilacea]|uniref:Uncharacterized protein n=1 Tax=Mycena albidolilacea TaxID=1033008 RepID=A0AAD7ET04_9AGAR|nr:hypothetical protein DFH08DRAFT_960121 [Mycena albidolilacea]
MELQAGFFPGLQNMQQREDEERACLAEGHAMPGISVSDLRLWLPSAIAAMEARSVCEIVVPRAVQEHEYRLRVGQANESLHKVRRLLLVRTHLYKLKDTTSRGVRANMRSQDKILVLNDQIRRAADQYRMARVALVMLGGVLERNGWERTLKDLREDNTKKRKTKKQRCEAKTPHPPSWIWLVQGQVYDPADGVTMNEVWIEWAKPRVRCHRWREEVDLLEEEMGQREGDNVQVEGEAAYAVRQAAIESQLACATGASNARREGAAGNEDTDAEDENRDKDGEEDEKEDSDDEEELPIPSLPQRPTKPTYVDEVLTM